MFGAMHFISYMNRPIATKVNSTYLAYGPTTACIILQVDTFIDIFTNISINVSICTIH